MKTQKGFGFIRRLLLILISLSLITPLTGCQQILDVPSQNAPPEEIGLRGGFTKSGSIQYPHYCAFQSDKREFDIDDVTITFYYGVDLSYHSLYEYREEMASYLSFDLSFESFTIGCTPIYYTARHIDENFISEKYLCNVRYTPDGKTISDIEFEHSEEIKLPCELFANETGCIWLRLIGDNILRSEEEESRIICSTSFWYKRSGNKITLSKYEQS